jgi:hypothetical protein
VSIVASHARGVDDPAPSRSAVSSSSRDAKGLCLLTDAPGVVSEEQLRELHIKLRKPVEPEKIG